MILRGIEFWIDCICFQHLEGGVLSVFSREMEPTEHVYIIRETGLKEYVHMPVWAD